MCAKSSAPEPEAGRHRHLGFFQLVAPGLDGERIRLDPSAAQHLAKSLRARVGDRVPLTDGRGARGVAEITAWDRRGVELALLERSTVAPPGRRFWLAARATGARFDWLLEKAVELGVWGILPMAEGGGRAGTRRERWARVVRAACEQCLTAWEPGVADPAPLSEILAGTETRPWRGIAVADPTGTPAGALPASRLPEGDLLLVVGPPEGFTEPERAALRGVSGLVSLAFGPRRLRAETAALAALVWANALPGAGGDGRRP